MNKLTSSELIDQLNRIESRLMQYKKLGYDIIGSRKFVLNCAGTLTPEILELGTGKGHTALAIAQAGYFLISVDNNSEMLDIARAWIARSGLSNKVSLVYGNIEGLKFPNNSFSTIISVDLWHHLSNYEKALDEMFRVWNGKGKLVIADMNERGMDIVNQLHVSEGRIHPSGKIGIDKLGDMLAGRKIAFNKYDDMCEMVYIINKKEN